MKRLALKRLSASDLTYFEYHFLKGKGTNQKAVNLDHRVFVDNFYPHIEDIDGGAEGIIHPLTIYGPKGVQPISLMRRTQRLAKNWRLGGSIVRSDTDPDRYADLKTGDYALCVFFGETYPDRIDLFLVASGASEDAPLFSLLDSNYAGFFSGRRGMVELSESHLLEVLSSGISTGLFDGSHQVFDFLDFSEDLGTSAAIAGGPDDILRLPGARPMSKEQLEKRKQTAEKVGEDGEEIINLWLTGLVEKNEILSFEWSSRKNAVSPFDFKVTDSLGAATHVDAKSTGGVFKSPFYLSIGELRKAADPLTLYQIYRIYELTQDGRWAKLRIAELETAYVHSILNHLKGLPEGVRVDGVAINPEGLGFGEEITLNYIMEQSEPI